MTVIRYEWLQERQQNPVAGGRMAGTPASVNAKGRDSVNRSRRDESGPRLLRPATASDPRNAPETTAQATARENVRLVRASDFSEKTDSPSPARLRLRERMRASVAEAGQEDDDLVRVRPLVDVRKLAAEGWDAEPVGPDGTAAWKHPYLGYVWTPKAGSPKWFAQPHGELFRFGPFASIDDAISALERRGGAA